MQWLGLLVSAMGGVMANATIEVIGLSTGSGYSLFAYTLLDYAMVGVIGFCSGWDRWLVQWSGLLDLAVVGVIGLCHG